MDPLELQRKRETAIAERELERQRREQEQQRTQEEKRRRAEELQKRREENLRRRRQVLEERKSDGVLMKDLREDEERRLLIRQAEQDSVEDITERFAEDEASKMIEWKASPADQRKNVSTSSRDIMPFLAEYNFNSSPSKGSPILDPTLFVSGVGAWEEDMEDREDESRAIYQRRQFGEPLELGEKDARLEVEIEQLIEDVRPSPRMLIKRYHQRRKARRAKQRTQNTSHNVQDVEKPLQICIEDARELLGDIQNEINKQKVNKGVALNNHGTQIGNRIHREMLRRNYRHDDLMCADIGLLTPKSLQKRHLLEKREAKLKQQRLMDLNEKVSAMRQRFRYDFFLDTNDRKSKNALAQENAQIRRHRRERRQLRPFERFGMYLSPLIRQQPAKHVFQLPSCRGMSLEGKYSVHPGEAIPSKEKSDQKCSLECVELVQPGARMNGRPRDAVERGRKSQGTFSYRATVQPGSADMSKNTRAQTHRERSHENRYPSPAPPERGLLRPDGPLRKRVVRIKDRSAQESLTDANDFKSEFNHPAVGTAATETPPFSRRSNGTDDDVAKGGTKFARMDAELSIRDDQIKERTAIEKFSNISDISSNSRTKIDTGTASTVSRLRSLRLQLAALEQ